MTMRIYTPQRNKRFKKRDLGDKESDPSCALKVLSGISLRLSYMIKTSAENKHMVSCKTKDMHFFKQAIKVVKGVPKKTVTAAVLLGMLFAVGESRAGITRPAITGFNSNIAGLTGAGMTPTGEHGKNTAQTSKAAKMSDKAEEKMLITDTENVKPRLCQRPLAGKAMTEHEKKKSEKIVKTLGIANRHLSEETKALYARHIINISKQFELDPALVTGVVIIESTAKSSAVSSAGARGLMQVMWSVHGKSLNKKFGYKNASDLLDPEKGLTAGCWILKGYIERSEGNLQKALSSYFGGQGSSHYYNRIMKWVKMV